MITNKFLQLKMHLFSILLTFGNFLELLFFHKGSSKIMSPILCYSGLKKCNNWSIQTLRKEEKWIYNKWHMK